MNASTPRSGDVVLFGASRYVVLRVAANNRAAVCPVLQNADDRHRADIRLEWPDSLALGLVGDVTVRCAPIVIRNARALRVVTSAPGLMFRIDRAVNREMGLQAQEDAWKRPRMAI